MRSFALWPRAMERRRSSSTSRRGGAPSRSKARYTPRSSLETHHWRTRRIFEVLRVDEAYFAHAPVEHDRVRAHAAREDTHALQELAVGDTGRDEADVLSARELLGAVHLVLVGHAHPPCARSLVVVAELEPAEDLAADTGERGRGEHALGGAAAAHDRV